MTFPGIFPTTFLPQGLIHSIQTGEITIAAGASSNTATINAVNTLFSVCFFGGWRSADTSLVAREDYTRVSLTNATTVTAETNTANAGASRIARYTVVEFEPFCIKQIIQGTIVIAASSTSNTATIASIDTNNSVVMHIGQTYDTDNDNFNYNQGRLVITNSTTITANRDSTIGALTVGYVVIEFHPGITRSIQPVSIIVSAGLSTQNATINAVDDTATFLIWGGWTVRIFSIPDARYYPYLRRTSTTNVAAVRTAVDFAESRANGTVVEFETRYVKSRQAGQTQIISTSAAALVALSTVDTSKSVSSWIGLTGSVSAAGSNASYTTTGITSPTVLTVDRGGNPSNTVTTSWEVIEFV